MKVYALMELRDAWDSEEWGSPLYGVPSPVCEKVVDIFLSEDKAIEEAHKAEARNEETGNPSCPCQYDVVEYEVK